MSGPRKKSGGPSTDDRLDLRLGTLFGELGAALSEMIDRLEDGAAGEIRRDHAFQTERGPVHAQAGIRIRFAGTDTAPAGRDTARPRATREASVRTRASAPVVRSIDADIFEDGQLWRMTADLPGVGRKDLDLAIEDGHLLISAQGRGRSFTGRVAVPPETTRGDLRVSLQNGILEIEAPTKGEGAA